MNAPKEGAPANPEQPAPTPAPKRFGGKRVKIAAIVLGVMALQAVAAALLLPKGHSNTAAGQSVEAEHSGTETHGEKADSLFEVEIGKFSVSIELEDAILWNVSFTLVAAVEPEAQAHLAEAVTERYKARVRQAVVKVVRTSSIKDVKDPQLENLKRFLKTEINNVLPQPYVREIIISEIRTMQL